MIVLDTNVISEMMRPQPDPGVQAWLDDQSNDALFITSVTMAKLLFGVRILPSGSRKDRLGRVLDGMLALFPGRVLSFDLQAAQRYADLAASSRKAGRPLPVADGFIAAIAASRKFAVATRNTSDFECAGVEIIDPWAAG